MSSGRFRSTAVFSPRARASVIAVDRATLVIFSIGAHRFAVPVERVERVLRADIVERATGASDNAVSYAGRSLTLANLAASLGLVLTPSDRSRVLVFAERTGWVAAAVDGVHEVATIDAAIVAPLASDGSQTYWPVGALGVFDRLEQRILVLDVTRALAGTSPEGFRHDAHSAQANDS